MTFDRPEDFIDAVARRDPHQPEFLQAVREVMVSLWPFVQANPQYGEYALLERLVEPTSLGLVTAEPLDPTGGMAALLAALQRPPSDGSAG